MADRSIVVTLRANVADFQRQIQSSSKTLEDLAKKAGQTEGVSQTTLGRIAQSAQLQRDSWDAAGGALVAYGSAITGIGLAAAKTGIEYNQLQQTTRAALTTILGSAEAAADQMDRLDDFARQSPFAKQTFITAQQQMLAFGIEAEKVVGYLGGIEDAVAAAGGSNQQIAELSYIFAQISAAGKITAQDLMQFGQRGVDAATLIGSQMGLTGAEIREEITAGTLDAGQALDALAAGMEERFGGAAASVKETLTGAFDRVKAAWRDISADLMEPLVSSTGGGFLVDTLNGLASLMRAFEDLPGPIKSFVAAGGLASGAISLLAGGLLLVTPRFLDFQARIDELKGRLPGFSSGLKGVALRIGALSAVVGIGVGVWQYFAQKQAEADARVRELTSSLDESTGALTENTRAAIVSRLESEGALTAYQNMGGNLADLTDALMGNSDAQGRVNAVVDESRGFLGAYSRDAMTVRRIMGELTGELDRAQEAWGREKAASESAGGALSGVEMAARAAEGATGSMADAQDLLTAASDTTADSLETQRSRLQALMDLERERAGIVQTAMEAESRYQEAIDRASDAIAENGATLDLNTEQGRKNQAALLAISDAGLDVVESLMAQGAPAQEVRASMERTRASFISTAESMGLSTEEANALADSLGLIPGTYSAMVSLSGVSQAISRLGALDSTLNSINGKTATAYVTIRQQGQAALADGGAVQRFAAAGAVYGPGGPRDDLVPALLSNGEHVLTAAEVLQAGGQEAVYRMRAAIRAGTLRFADGGTPSRVYQPAQYMTQISAPTPTLSLDGTPITAVFPGLPAIRGVIRQEIGADHAATAAAGGTR